MDREGGAEQERVRGQDLRRQLIELEARQRSQQQPQEDERQDEPSERALKRES